MSERDVVITREKKEVDSVTVREGSLADETVNLLSAVRIMEVLSVFGENTVVALHLTKRDRQLIGEALARYAAVKAARIDVLQNQEKER